MTLFNGAAVPSKSACRAVQEVSDPGSRVAGKQIPRRAASSTIGSPWTFLKRRIDQHGNTVNAPCHHGARSERHSPRGVDQQGPCPWWAASLRRRWESRRKTARRHPAEIVGVGGTGNAGRAGRPVARALLAAAIRPANGTAAPRRSRAARAGSSLRAVCASLPMPAHRQGNSRPRSGRSPSSRADYASVSQKACPVVAGPGQAPFVRIGRSSPRGASLQDVEQANRRLLISMSPSLSGRRPGPRSPGRPARWSG